MTNNVHPYAARFPMLPADELQALADDIAANGQIRPITLWVDTETGEQVLIDGRNRQAACDLVDIEAKTEIFEGDPYAFIRSANNRRRNMTAGQEAAADAFALIDQGLRISGKWKYGAKTLSSVDSDALRQAGVIWDWDPDLLQKVLDGTVTLPKAYDDVNEKRVKREKEDAQRSALANQAGDLLRLTTDGALSFDEAWAAYMKRTEEERERKAEIEKGIRTGNFEVAECVYKLAGYDVERFIKDKYPRHPEFVESGIRITKDRLQVAIDFLTLLRRETKK